MKNSSKLIIGGFSILLFAACNSSSDQPAASPENTTESTAPLTGQLGVQDETSEKNVVQIAVGSKDHTTLVAAVKAGELVDALSNAGPFTVFAPTNAAFDKLPAGTVDGLLKPEAKESLQDILQYHVTTSSLKAEYFTDGMNVGMVNGGNVTVSVKDGKIMLNGTATIVASIPASNGTVHVIDGVLVPPAAK